MKNDMSDKKYDKNLANSKDVPHKGSFRDKAGNVIEKVGHKVADAGATKLGQKIHDLGDSMEKRHDNPKHPHKI